MIADRKTPVTSDEIEAMLIRNRFAASTVVPNYTPDKWWECDVLEVTAAGYFREYEIKMSRADFLRDHRKSSEVRIDWRKQMKLEREAREAGLPPPVRPVEKKHDLLASRSPRGPVQFWYVIPKGLVRMNEIPEWAGFIEVEIHGTYLAERELIKAPRLHGEKLAKAILDHAVGVCYYRFHSLLSKVAGLRSQAVESAKLLQAFGWPKTKPGTI